MSFQSWCFPLFNLVGAAALERACSRAIHHVGPPTECWIGQLSWLDCAAAGGATRKCLCHISLPPAIHRGEEASGDLLLEVLEVVAGRAVLPFYVLVLGVVW